MDEPGSWEAEYRPRLIEGDRATAVGETRYSDGKTYDNLWVLRFDGDRCAEFVEWYMTRPATDRLLTAPAGTGRRRRHVPPAPGEGRR